MLHGVDQSPNDKSCLIYVIREQYFLLDSLLYNLWKPAVSRYLSLDVRVNKHMKAAQACQVGRLEGLWLKLLHKGKLSACTLYRGCMLRPDNMHPEVMIKRTTFSCRNILQMKTSMMIMMRWTCSIQIMA